MEYNQLIDEISCATPRRKCNYQYKSKSLWNWLPTRT